MRLTIGWIEQQLTSPTPAVVQRAPDFDTSGEKSIVSWGFQHPAPYEVPL